MKPEARKYLVDISLSAKAIMEYVENINGFSEFAKNQLLVDAIERRLAIIGEALNRAIHEDDAIIVTDAKKIIGLRHILIHNYDLIDAPIIWKIINNNIRTLQQEIDNLLL
jgi:uncharacterized protein with HEPN domain